MGEQRPVTDEDLSHPFEGPEGFDRFFELSLVPSLVLDIGARKILRVNRAALDILGLPESEVVGRPGADFLVEPSEEQILRVRSLRGDRTVAVREVRTVYGSRIVELNLVPSGVDEIVLVQAIDLTDLLDAAHKAEARVEELSRKSAVLETIAARLAHDLRSPMTTIAGFATLLRDRADAIDPADRTEMAGRIASSAHALASLTEAILSEAQIGTTEVSSGSHDVGDLLRFIRDASAAQFAEADGELVTTSSVARLPVSIGAISQALVNVVSNAVKYRDPDRPLEVHVDVSSRADGRVVIETADNGRGFGTDPGALLDAGIRGPSSEGTMGSGLGLAMTRAALDSMGGELELIDRPVGATVRFVLAATVAEDRPSVLGGSFSSGLSAAQLGRILDASPIPTVVIDLDRREIVRANDAMTDLLGTDRSEIVGRPGADFLDEEDVAAALRASALASPGTFTSSDVGVRAAGAPVRARVALTAVPDTMLAVAQVIPLDAVGRGEQDLRTIASIASAGGARAETLGLEGLVDLLHRIDDIARRTRSSQERS